MSAEEFYQGNFRSKYNTMEKVNKKIQQFDFYDMIEFAEAYHKAELVVGSEDYIAKKSLEILELVESQEYKNKKYIHEMHKMIINKLKNK